MNDGPTPTEAPKGPEPMLLGNEVLSPEETIQARHVLHGIEDNNLELILDGVELFSERTQSGVRLGLLAGKMCKELTAKEAQNGSLSPAMQSAQRISESLFVQSTMNVVEGRGK